MKDETIQELSEVFCRTFHSQEWDYDCAEPSEINRTAWKNCVKAVIEAYEKQKEI
jgi:hypothetical protein